MPLLLHPEFLAQFDIVFVQYETFLRDYQVYIGEKRELRHKSRFPSMTSPLFRLQWWRIVFDEMQLVETNMDALIRCNTLDSVNMWCVSGTPFNRNLQDLFSIVRLLRLPTYDDRDKWTKCIAVRIFHADNTQNPMKEGSPSARRILQSLISDYFWCTTFDDLQRLSPNLIPPQHRVIHHILLSGVEVASLLHAQE